MLQRELGEEPRRQLAGLLEKAAAIQSEKEAEKLAAVVGDAESMLSQAAAARLPNITGPLEATRESVHKLGEAFGFLHSQLARTAMPPEEWTALQERLLKEARGINPYITVGKDVSLMSGIPILYDFVPPGKTEYPFWIMQDEVMQSSFRELCGYTRFEYKPNGGKQTNVCLNDMMMCSRSMRNYINIWNDGTIDTFSPQPVRDTTREIYSLMQDSLAIKNGQLISTPLQKHLLLEL